MTPISRFLQIAATMFVTAILLCPRLPGARAEEPSFLTGSVGVFDVTQGDRISPAMRFDFAPGVRILDIASFFHGFGPMVGVMANTDGGVFGYGGIFADVRIGERIVVRPQFGVGGYRKGGSKDLGGVFQYHIAGEAAYRLDSGHRIGVTFAHISNNDIHEGNPGENDVMITYSILLQSLF